MNAALGSLFSIVGVLASLLVPGANSATTTASTEVFVGVKCSLTPELAARGGSALSRAGQALDRAGLTRAGRALEKHGSRPGSVFPKATGNVAAKNAQGQAALDDILGNVGRTSPNKFGGLDYFGGSRGGGARFDGQGNFIGFLEP